MAKRTNRPEKFRGGTVKLIDMKHYIDRDYISVGWLKAAAEYRPNGKDVQYVETERNHEYGVR